MDLLDEIETLEVGDIEDVKFGGKKFGEMNREELLAAINWLETRRRGLEAKAKKYEEKYIEAAKEAGY